MPVPPVQPNTALQADSSAGAILAAAQVDECQLYLVPVLVGGGKPCLPRAVRRKLELFNVRQFANGTVHLRYRVDS